MVVPPDSVVKIYTDSMNYCVHTFQRVDDPLVSMRKILKIPNHDVWRLIKNLTGKKNLACLLFKVKAHSGDLYNDLADLEAGKGLDASPITINPQFIPDGAMIPMWDCIGPIDRDIRKFCQTITDAITFDLFTSNNKL
ncbi:unnamed protein product [Rhizophagus irregularis]|uniref:RNase H type-1 domain-containing protein n=1 Tax=Rhizophagus irregularis TaxID=588596 RepID=A0A916EDV4_9GLOM|nr:unnamed protein product [Rhizophagus irregularis]